MPTVRYQPPRPKNTISRSISFDIPMFEFAEQQRKAKRLDRSQYMREVMQREYQHVLGTTAPALGDSTSPATPKRNGIALFPAKAGASSATLEVVNRLRDGEGA